MCAPEHNKQHAIETTANIIKRSRRGVVLTGAGVSTPSGIPDFRSTGGLWQRYDAFEVASLSAFRYHPENFFHWLRTIALEIEIANPNSAHLALAQLENAGYIQTIITQNVDGLHQQAGSRNVIEVHGTLSTATCIRCYRIFKTQGLIEPFLETGVIPHCTECGGVLKPDIILYEEQLPYKTWANAENASRISDLYIVVGSSLEVMPVAGLPVLAVERGAPLVIINKTPTYLDVRASVVIRGDAAEILPAVTSLVIEG
jgi:NAD-dependent deacetylase